jgi:hypothetical protein
MEWQNLLPLAQLFLSAVVGGVVVHLFTLHSALEDESHL